MKSVVSFVANDRVNHFLEPFLRSFRTHMPLQELVMIPYDAASHEASRLAESFGVQIHSPLALLGDIDATSRQVYGFTVGHFRKLAALSLDADSVLMLDIDVIMLDSLSGVFEAFYIKQPGFLFAERSTDFVYSAQGRSQFPQSMLFSTGFVMLDPSVHSLDQVLHTASIDFDTYRDVCHLAAYDQPLLNLYADIQGVRCASVDETTESSTGISYFMDPQIRLRYGDAPPTGRVGERHALMLHFAGLGNYSGDFAHQEAVHYYSSVNDSGAK